MTGPSGGRAVLDPAAAVRLLQARPLTALTGVLLHGDGTRLLDPGSVLPVATDPATVVLTLPSRPGIGADESHLVLDLGEGGPRLDCRVLDQRVVGELLVAVCRVGHAEGWSDPGPPEVSTRRSFGRADDAYRRARDLVLLRQYAADTTLDPDELAFDLGADPTAALYALAQLEADGLVRRDPDRGYVVEPYDVRSSDETFDARCAIEVGVLQTSLGDVRDEDVAELGQSFDRMSRHLVGDRFLDFDGYLDANLQFHERIVMLGRNAALRQAFLRLGVKAVMTRSFGATRATSQRFVDVQRAMLDGIAAGDLGAACAATTAYRDLAKSRARAIFEQTGGWL